MRDLSQRIRDRRLFAARDSFAQEDDEIRRKLEAAGYDLRYYWGSSSIALSPYVPYQGEGEAIYVRMKDGCVKELSEVSSFVRGLAESGGTDDNMVFFPGGFA